MLEDVEDLTCSFSQEDIETQARGNLNGIILGSLAHARAHRRYRREWVTFIGLAFAPAWTTITTPRAAVAVALNCASAGCGSCPFQGHDPRQDGDRRLDTAGGAGILYAHADASGPTLGDLPAHCAATV